MMVGILIIAHGTLGDSLIHCASHVTGQRPAQLLALGVTIHDDPQAVLANATSLVQSLDRGKGVLVLSDIYGATPCNIATKLMIPGRVTGLAGVNLPMLVRALTYRCESLNTVAMKARSGGTDGIVAIDWDMENAATAS